MENSKLDQDIRTTRKNKILSVIKAVESEQYENLEDLSSSINVTLITIEKYLNDKQLMLSFMDESKYKKIFDIYKKLKKNVQTKKDKEKYELVSGIIHDILYTRFRIEDIYRRHYISVKTLARILADEEYLKKNFGENIIEIINEKIKKNASIRRRVLDDRIVIEEESDLRVLKEEIISLSYADYRKLKIIAKYIQSGANVKYVMQELDLPFKTLLETIASTQNDSFIKEKVFEQLQRYSKIERILAETVDAKQQLIIACASRLMQTNYNVEEVSQELEIPYYLLERILTDDYAYFVFEQNVIDKINNCFDVDNSKKNII